MGLPCCPCVGPFCVCGRGGNVSSPYWRFDISMNRTSVEGRPFSAYMSDYCQKGPRTRRNTPSTEARYGCLPQTGPSSLLAQTYLTIGLPDPGESVEAGRIIEGDDALVREIGSLPYLATRRQLAPASFQPHPDRPPLRTAILRCHCAAPTKSTAFGTMSCSQEIR